MSTRSKTPVGVSSMTSMTFAITGEDHTLGNALRSILAGQMAVEFVGYSIPHPTQDEMNIRLQTHERSAVEVLEEGLDDLIGICDHLTKLWVEATKKFSAKQEQQ